MKKLLCLLLAVLVLTLAACADPHPTNGEQTAPNESTAQNAVQPTGKGTVPEDTTESMTGETEEASDPTAETEPPDPEEAILGTWVTEYYMTELNCGMEGFYSDAGLPLCFTFYANGKVTMATCEEGLEEAVADLEADLLAYRLDLMYEMIDDQGMTLEEANERFLNLYGMTVPEYVAYITEEEHLLDAFANINTSTSYSIRGDTLHIGSFELTFQLEGDTLTFLECNDDRFLTTLGVEEPLVLTRITEE